MDSKFAVAIIMLMLASGCFLIAYDRSDGGVKLMSDDDYNELFIPDPSPSISIPQLQTNDIHSENKLRDGDSFYSLIEY